MKRKRKYEQDRIEPDYRRGEVLTRPLTPDEWRWVSGPRQGVDWAEVSNARPTTNTNEIH